MKKCSVVISVFNEELSLPSFYKKTLSVLEQCSWDYELIFVNDGSTDKSMRLLEEYVLENQNVYAIEFSRNYGHEAAMLAGIDFSSGDGVICMDADLQHPPEFIPKIIEQWEQGFDIINMVCTKNQDAGFVKRITSKLFYKILNGISPVKFENNASDFFAVSKRVAEILKHDYRERVRYLRGIIQIVGFEKTKIEYEANKREAGESKYNIRKLIKFSVNTMFSFSDLPLRLGIYMGFLVALSGFILMIYTIVNKFLFNVPSGYSTIIVALCFMFSIVLMVIGVIGQYISVLFSEIKQRPLYLIKEIKGKEKNVE